jgi:hypothetical protein
MFLRGRLDEIDHGERREAHELPRDIFSRDHPRGLAGKQPGRTPIKPHSRQPMGHLSALMQLSSDMLELAKKNFQALPVDQRRK